MDFVLWPRRGKGFARSRALQGVAAKSQISWGMKVWRKRSAKKHSKGR